MTGRRRINRRRFLTLTGAGAGSLLLAGCDAWSSGNSGVRPVLRGVENLTEAAQRLFLSEQTLAREYSEAEISAYFRANGNTTARDPAYDALKRLDFADYRLPVTGLVDTPLSLSLADLRGMEARTQITRHDCVEGWSCIGKWKGPQLGPILLEAGLQPDARYVVFRCFDDFGNTLSGRVYYYESLALEDCFHPQTILAYEMNDEVLPEAHGAPLRLRVERQLGYKHAKYLKSIEVVSTLSGINGGFGGYYEDRDGYEWYAGI